MATAKKAPAKKAPARTPSPRHAVAKAQAAKIRESEPAPIDNAAVGLAERVAPFADHLTGIYEPARNEWGDPLP